MPDLHIRTAERADVPLILRFVRELAIYEKALDEVVATEATVEQSLFDDGARAFAFICEDAGDPVGFAVCFYSYSTWLARNGLYLEDLYVTPEARGRGAGKALLQYLARLAVDQGCGRFEWSVLDWNTPAIDFYESVGARPQSEWTTYRLAGDALARFAAG
ncbi:diamine N-acetyltransferase protein [Salinisphaera shabanensis E1L3A]|jgi:GNAT superfamily N-acetyltransferase|uniref:Diamine N-acetyltransferase protein n=1 Tax=Salinisphaera shabanensis E1L3A TaxID=1033802 RepID=U2E4N9_9GAMM|nr:GNAT family N-acetyltransferase [Salinisphaera shabanensis]ERJ18811.1 diamine N-acetyltransferase protein [Salinisphaera shabanensis E1L3A]